MSVDFTLAMAKHSAWKSKLRDFLDGRPGLTAAEATSHRDCELGVWLYGEGLPRFGVIPEMSVLERVHEQLHRTVRRIVDLKGEGRAREAEAEFAKIDGISREILGLLATLERKLDRRAG